MKKLFVVLLALTFLVLSACSAKINKLFDIQRDISALDTVKCVTDKEKYTSDDTIIRYTITNISDEYAFINSDDECFELHKLVDDKWKYVGTKEDHEWTDMALYLPPNETETREINLKNYFHLPLEKGIYRIVVENIVSNTFEIF